MSRKVDFLVVGTQKGGTTALDGYLRQHPALCLPGKKELHFFDDDSRFTGGAMESVWYESWFRPSDGHLLLGECTPAYMYWQDAPRRIWQYNPGMKLIALLRNPVERAYSHWNMQRLRGWERRGFLQAVKGEWEACRGFLPSQCLRFSYVSRGYYSEQIRRLQRFFPPEQLLFLRSDVLRTSPQEVMEAVWGFLGVPSRTIEPVDEKGLHVLPYEAPMQPEARRYLMDLYEFEIRQLERMLGWDCGDWLH